MKTTPQITIARLRPATPETNPLQGRVVWSPVKSLWYLGHLAVLLAFGWATWNAPAALLSCSFAAATVCLGGVGMHRLLIHRSFRCPRWLEYVLVHLGLTTGTGGPLGLIHYHDLRDWAQRHPACHPFLSDQSPVWRDYLWQVHCDLRLTHPPRFDLDPAIRDDHIYPLMQRTWMLQQLPWALLFFAVAGGGGLVWGISGRIVFCVTGQWLVSWLMHRCGERDWHLHDHAVQGFNLPHVGLITMGEGWHNNHHAFPDSARLGLKPGQHDPGWWVILCLRACGLAWDVKEPGDLPPRPDLVRLDDGDAAKPRASAFFDLHLL